MGFSGHSAWRDRKQPMSAEGLGRVKTLGEKRDTATLTRRGYFLLSPDRCHERLDAHYIHHAGEIIGQHV